MAILARELAAKLGVSPSAVSIALNGKPGISDETRQMILAEAERNGLKPSRRKSSRGQFISLVIYKKSGYVNLATAFFSTLTESITLQASEAGYPLQMHYFHADADPGSQLRSLQQPDCCGIILLATESFGNDIAIFRQIAKPIVVLDSYSNTYEFDSVTINNVQGAYLATSYLLECGHQRIGHLASSIQINNFSERRHGFYQAMSEKAGSEAMELRVSATQEGAYHDISSYLDTMPVLPTAFFADNDDIAVSGMRAFLEHGYQIPEDISFVGFDDNPSATAISPKLTTVRVYRDTLGGRAVRRLLEKIREDDQAFLHICVSTSLIIRESVK